MAGEKLSLIGPAAFYVGLIIAIVTIFVAPSGWLYLGLAVLGVIVGLANVTAKESGAFLLATIAFVVTCTGMATLIALNGVTIPAELLRLAANITVLVGAGAVVIALKAIYEMAKEK
ncbi:MAG: hypothetical protein QW567_01830 [Candidatus Hadarchaeales archaeon]